MIIQNDRKEDGVEAKIAKRLDNGSFTMEVPFIFLNLHFRQHLKIVIGRLLCILPQQNVLFSLTIVDVPLCFYTLASYERDI
jgi:hypothetical protein